MANNNENKINKNDLFMRLLPAFNTKIKEWERAKIYHINAVDLWNYCLKNIWQEQNNLHICDLVADILNIDIIEFQKYNDRNDI